MKELIIWLNHPPWHEFSCTTWSLEPVCLQHSSPKHFGGLLLEECGEILKTNFILIWGLGKSVFRHLAKFSGGVCVWGWRGWYKWIVPDQVPFMEVSPLSFSPCSWWIDNTFEMCSWGNTPDFSVYNWPFAPYRVPSTGDPQESPQNLLLVGSLSSFLSLASGLVAYIYCHPLSWAHPDCWPIG